jgi:DNA repair protein RadC
MAVKSESTKTYNSNPIHSWAVEDRPREKMSLKGKNALSDAELIAILLGSGNREDSAVEVAKKILKSVDNNLNALGELTLKDLQKTRGIGEAKAITIAAALELGLRRQASLALERPQIRSSIDAFHIMAPLLMDLAHEEFWILALNRANKVVGKVKISSGGLSGTVVDSKKLFQRALEFERISALVLCHNHPSGNLKPSESDIELTKKLVAAALLLDMKVLDHIIIAGSGYMSFADSGYI